MVTGATTTTTDGGGTRWRRRRRRRRRFAEPRLDSFDGDVEDEVAELHGISVRRGVVSIAGESATTVARVSDTARKNSGRERESASVRERRG